MKLPVNGGTAMENIMNFPAFGSIDRYICIHTHTDLTEPGCLVLFFTKVASSNSTLQDGTTIRNAALFLARRQNSCV
jgi:hypothetical protein